MSQIQNRFKIGYLQNNGHQQQPAANIGHQTCISVSTRSNDYVNYILNYLREVI